MNAPASRRHHTLSRPRWGAKGITSVVLGALLVAAGLGAESASVAAPVAPAAAGHASTAVTERASVLPETRPQASRSTGNLRGTIRSDKGALAPRAEITLSKTGTRVTVTANSKGRYSVKGLKPGKYNVAVRPGKDSPTLVVRRTTATVVKSKTVTRNVKLFTGGRVSGTVTGFDGAVVANATVRVWMNSRSASAVTDSRGKFVVRGLNASSAVVAVDAGDAYFGASRQTTVALNRTSTVNFVLGKPASVRGTVTSEITGEPIEGIKVTLKAGVNPVSSTVTDASGRYEFARTGSRTVSVFASVDDDADPVPNFLRTSSRDYSTKSGTAAVIDVKMLAGATLSGTVTDKDGVLFESGSVRYSVLETPTYDPDDYDEDGDYDEEGDHEVASGIVAVDGTFTVERLNPTSTTLRTSVELQYCDSVAGGAVTCTHLSGADLTLTRGETTEYSVAKNPVFLGYKGTSISGSAVVGATLTANPSSAWRPTPATWQYRWFRDGSVIDGATNRDYTVAAEDAGHRLSVEVTGSRTRFTTRSDTSGATAVVTAGSAAALIAPSPAASSQPSPAMPAPATPTPVASTP